MTFDEWWEDFVTEHEEWKYADSAALRRAAFQAGAASRDAEIAELIGVLDDLVREVTKADEALSAGDRSKALQGVRTAETAASLAKATLAKVRKP